jgi:hypothetical protein
MRRPPRSGPISRRSRATVASPNSSASTRRSSRRGSPTVAGTSRPPRATRTLRMSSSAPPDFSTSRSFLTLRDPRISAARLFHSARWNHAVPYAGKRWGVIGSGASGVQITEALAWAGCDVTQFIRRAQWVHIRENPPSNWRERLKLRLPGGYQREQRRLWQFINEFDQWRLKPGHSARRWSRSSPPISTTSKTPS